MSPVLPSRIQRQGLEEPTHLEDHNFAASLLQAWMCMVGDPPSVPQHLRWSGEGPAPFPCWWGSVTSVGVWRWGSDLPCCTSPMGQVAGEGLWPPDPRSSPPPSCMAHSLLRLFLKFASGSISQVKTQNPFSFFSLLLS